MAIAVDDTFTITGNETLTEDVLGNDLFDAPLKKLTFTQPSQGTVVQAFENGGSFTFNPGLDFNPPSVGGQRAVSFGYTFTDASNSLLPVMSRSE